VSGRAFALLCDRAFDQIVASTRRASPDWFKRFSEPLPAYRATLRQDDGGGGGVGGGPEDAAYDPADPWGAQGAKLEVGVPGPVAATALARLLQGLLPPDPLLARYAKAARLGDKQRGGGGGGQGAAAGLAGAFAAEETQQLCEEAVERFCDLPGCCLHEEAHHRTSREEPLSAVAIEEVDSEVGDNSSVGSLREGSEFGWAPLDGLSKPAFRAFARFAVAQALATLDEREREHEALLDRATDLPSFGGDAEEEVEEEKGGEAGPRRSGRLSSGRLAPSGRTSRRVTSRRVTSGPPATLDEEAESALLAWGEHEDDYEDDEEEEEDDGGGGVGTPKSRPGSSGVGGKSRLTVDRTAALVRGVEGDPKWVARQLDPATDPRLRVDLGLSPALAALLADEQRFDLGTCAATFAELDGDGNRTLTFEEINEAHFAFAGPGGKLQGFRGLLETLAPPLGAVLGSVLGEPSGTGGEESSGANEPSAEPSTDEKASEALCRHAWHSVSSRRYQMEVPQSAFADCARSAVALAWGLGKARAVSASAAIKRAAREHRQVPATLAELPPKMVEWLLGSDFVQFCEEKFQVLDVKNQNVLRVEDSRRFLRSICKVPMQSNEVRRFINLFDHDGNGELSRSEFSSFMTWTVIRKYLEENPPALIDGSDQAPGGSRSGRSAVAPGPRPGSSVGLGDRSSGDRTSPRPRPWAGGARVASQGSVTGSDASPRARLPDIRQGKKLN